MNKRIFSLFLLGILILSCESKGPKVNSDLAEQIVMPLNIQKGGEFSSLAEIRAQAKALIDSRSSKDDKALSFLTYGFWSPEFVYNDRKMSAVDEYAGIWIDFKDDYGYEYGFYGDVLGTGRYHYRIDDNVLLMLDDNAEKEPKVWRAPYNGDIMALSGTHEFGVNNGMQIKMVPLETKPAKS